LSVIDELEDQLDMLAIRILPPMRATKYVDADAFAQLNELVSALARELAGADDHTLGTVGSQRELSSVG
jgi:hypothetical protein